jgi:hypothetical protein
MLFGEEMKSQRWYQGVSAVLLILSMALRVWPQQGQAHETVLELKVDAADVVVRGTVLAVQRHEAGQSSVVTVTVKVLETVKGENRSSIEFAEVTSTDSNLEEQVYNNWRTAGYEFLWFIRKPATGQSASYPLLAGWDDEIPLVQDIRPLTPKPYSPIFQPAYLTAELRVLSNPDEILAVVRKAASYRATKKGECVVSGIAPGCAVGVPYRMLVRPGDGNVQYLHMPVDERMETLCRRMIQRPAELWTIPAANSFSAYGVPDLEKPKLVREQGVRCLRSFRSEANIKLLKTIAKENPSPSTPYYRGPRFDAAAAAAETLKSWGITAR